MLIANDRPVRHAKVLVLGWTFKEDVPDIRNTRVIDIHNELLFYGVEVSCFDPEADNAEVKHEYGLELLQAELQCRPHDAVVLAVKHRALVSKFDWATVQRLGNGRPPVVVDVKGFFAKIDLSQEQTYWRL